MCIRDRTYATDATTEHFLSFETESGFPTADRLAAFLRLSLPTPLPSAEVGSGSSSSVGAKPDDPPHPFPELAGCAMIREVHVYGPAPVSYTHLMTAGWKPGRVMRKAGPTSSRMIDMAVSSERSRARPRRTWRPVCGSASGKGQPVVMLTCLGRQLPPGDGRCLLYTSRCV